MDTADAEFADRRLTLLLGYWNSRRGDRRAPRQQDVELDEIPRLRPILNLIEVERDPLAFRHRLVGDDVVDRLGRDVTGQCVGASLYAEAAEEIRASLATIVAEVRPYHRLARLDWFERRWLTMESLELPLLGDDGRVASILRGATFGVIQPPLPERLRFAPLEPDRLAGPRA